MGRVDIVPDQVPDASNWCFAIGPARTGSSALTKVIRLHPDALMYNEAWLWGFVMPLQNHTLDAETGDPNTKVWMLLQEHGHRDQGDFSYIGYHKDVPPLYASIVRRYMEGIRDAFYPGVSLYGDKRNAYRYFLDDLLNVFPNARLVYTDRNDWDSMASAFRRGRQQGVFDGMTRKQVARECYRLVRARNEQIKNLGILDGALSSDVHVVEFEDMGRALKDTTRDLLEFLELDPADYPWDKLPGTVHYKQAMGRQHDVPEIMELKKHYDGDTGR